MIFSDMANYYSSIFIKRHDMECNGRVNKFFAFFLIIFALQPQDFC